MIWLGHGQDKECGRNSARAKLMQNFPESTPDQAESRSEVTTAANLSNKTSDTSVGDHMVQRTTLPPWHHGDSKIFRSHTILKIEKTMYPSLRNSYQHFKLPLEMFYR